METTGLLGCLLCTVCFGSLSSQVNGLSGEVMWETELIKALVLNNTNYVREARPVQHHNDTVVVTVIPRFLRIENINEVENTFTTTIIMIQVWQDSRLAWNPAEFGGLRYTHVPADRLWLPDIIPYNTASQTNSDPLYEELAGVSNQGYIEWGPMMTITTECQMDVSDFPFDTQTCTILFGSWLRPISIMSLKFLRTNKTEMDFSPTDSNLPFSPNAYWDLVGTAKGRIEKIKYGASDFSVLSLTANMKRRDSFYKYLAIGPGALLGLLVPVLFLLPPRSQEKNTFGILIILGLILLISVLADSTPLNHANTPRMAIFYLITMVLIIGSLILSIIVSNLSFRGASRSPLPQWMQSLFLQDGLLRKMLCMSTSSPMKSIYGNFQSPEDISNSSGDTEGNTMTEQGGAVENKDIRNYLRFICEKLTADDAFRNLNQDWTEVARVIDRLLFVIFLVLYVITALALLT